MAAFQENKCYFCSFPYTITHHIVPTSFGGKDNAVNRINICSNCHHLIHHINYFLAYHQESKSFYLRNNFDPLDRIYPKSIDRLRELPEDSFEIATRKGKLKKEIYIEKGVAQWEWKLAQ